MVGFCMNSVGNGCELVVWVIKMREKVQFRGLRELFIICKLCNNKIIANNALIYQIKNNYAAITN